MVLFGLRKNPAIGPANQPKSFGSGRWPEEAGGRKIIPSIAANFLRPQAWIGVAALALLSGIAADPAETRELQFQIRIGVGRERKQQHPHLPWPGSFTRRVQFERITDVFQTGQTKSIIRRKISTQRRD